MDLLFWAYWFAVAATVLVACLRGGTPERLASTMVLAASVLNLLLTGDLLTDFLRVNWSLFLVDLALLAALTALSLKVDKWWTYAACGAQLASVLGHLPKLMGRAISAFAYGFLNTLWSYVVLATILCGIAAHQRRVRAAARRS